MLNNSFEFGPYRIDSVTRTLWCGSTLVALTGKEFDTLWALAEHAGTPIAKDRLLIEIWPDTHVSEGNLRQHVQALRKKLGKDATGQDYIRTIPNFGYLLAAEVVTNAGIGPAEPPCDEPEQQRQRVDASLPAPPHAGDVRTARQTFFPGLRRRSRWILALAAFGAGTAIIVVLFLARTSSLERPQSLPKGRLLARATSENRGLIRIPLSHIPAQVAMSPRGDKLFAVEDDGRTLSIVRTADNSVRTRSLPRDAGPLAISPDGKLYIGSHVDGVMVVDTDREQLIPRLMPTGGQVWDMAITPDGERLFLAMGVSGLKRLSTGSGKLVQISDRICPVGLAMDRKGEHLYVAYQCSGPAGRPGHDSVEILDVRTEASLGIISGPPMVGTHPSVSPDGKLVLLNGQDACSASNYDHAGCTSVPSCVYHLLRASDRQILRSFEFPAGLNGGMGLFLDNSRFVLSGAPFWVIDAAKYNTLESLNLSHDVPGNVVVAPDGRRAYFASTESHAILAMDFENAECTPPKEGLAMFYPADGSLDDAADVNTLTAHGDVRFVPGKVGQAFFFDGTSFLSSRPNGIYRLGLHDFSLSMYAKLATSDSEMVLIDWTDEGVPPVIRLLTSVDNRFVFQSWPGSSPLESKTAASLGIWYHLAVTKTESKVTLYVNGQPVANASPPMVNNIIRGPLLIGARSPGKPAFHGWLDEIAIYNRALTAEEVKKLYLLRESGPCKL